MNDELLTKAENYFIKGEFALAFNIYKKILEQDATNQYAHYCLGCIYTHLKNIPEAIKEFEEVIRISADTKEAKIAKWWLDELKNIIKKKKIIDEEDFVKPTQALTGSICAFHKDKEAEYVCNSCNKPICVKCTHPAKGGYFCAECYEKIKPPIRTPQIRKTTSITEYELEKKERKPKKWKLHLGIYLSLLLLVILYQHVATPLIIRNTGLKIVSSNGYYKEGKYIIEGKVKNEGNQTFGLITVRGTIYDSKGKKIAAGTTICRKKVEKINEKDEKVIHMKDIEKLISEVLSEEMDLKRILIRPNQTLPFKIEFKNVPSVTSYKVKIVGFKKEKTIMKMLQFKK